MGVYYFERESGILLFSNVTIQEELVGSFTNYNHIFIRELARFPDISTLKENEEEENLLNLLQEYYSDPNHLIPTIGLSLIIISTIASILIIRKKRIKRELEEYKRIMRTDKGLEKINQEKKVNS
ncbi:MAG: hypothetical protein EU548_04765 [Promethearchaeota archaeon]|nr:MAG: hypothetical protein EU548_04765 [Candidatus Lokiarchaeota archaeon]